MLVSDTEQVRTLDAGYHEITLVNKNGSVCLLVQTTVSERKRKAAGAARWATPEKTKQHKREVAEAACMEIKGEKENLEQQVRDCRNQNTNMYIKLHNCF